MPIRVALESPCAAREEALAQLQHGVVNLLDGVNHKDIAHEAGKRPNTEKCVRALMDRG